MRREHGDTLTSEDAPLADAGVPESGPERRDAPAWLSVAPFALVAGALAYNLAELFPELTPVAYLNDSAMHSEMVRFATSQLRAGTLPWTSWFPFLGLGSPQFLHYQSLGATIAGALGVGIGANEAFVITLYLLLATWPLSIYASARLFRLGRWPAACAAACSPFVVSLLGIGYEQISYLFIGFGLWSQLWAMWTLPLSWGYTYRAVREGRSGFLAALFITLTCSFHFMTGYLAFLVVPLFALLSWRDLGRCLARAAVLLVGAGLGAAWVVIPLLHFRPFASINQFLQNGPDVRSYGAPDALRWLADGQLLDARRWPVLTVLFACGLIAVAVRWRRDVAGRALVVALCASLVLFFGKPTLGSLENLLPGHADLFMRRFVMGVQLAAIFLAGIGLVALATLARRLLRVLWSRPVGVRLHVLGAAAAAAAVVGILAPAWQEVARSDASNAAYIESQKSADATSGAEVDALIRIARSHGSGRMYAGMPSNWGLNFTVGAVPVFRYLANHNVDEVGFTLRTASMMTNPEVEFDETNPGDYNTFGIRYLLLPATMSPPVPAHLLARRGDYALWERRGPRYIQVVDTIGPPIVTNRADLGTKAISFLDSALPGEARYPTLAYQGAPAPTPTLRAGAAPTRPAGSVLSEQDAPSAGRFRARVHATRTAVVLLSASYDPGWSATVDGRRVPTEMIAPALVGVRVPPGTHAVIFSYRGYRHYPELGVGSLAGLAVAGMGIAGLERQLSRRRRRRRHARGAASGPSGETPSPGVAPAE